MEILIVVFKREIRLASATKHNATQEDNLAVFTQIN